VVGDGDRVVWITSRTGIPSSELSFRFSRSGGPGGQHANRSETRVELLFDLAHSPSLSERRRATAFRKLAPYVDKNGILHLVSRSSRSQLRNREEVVERFRTLMRGALRVPRQRRLTKPTLASREGRLDEKRRRSELKRQRRRVLTDRH
jgi:ribosome-associated protein